MYLLVLGCTVSLGPYSPFVTGGCFQGSKAANVWS